MPATPRNLGLLVRDLGSSQLNLSLWMGLSRPDLPFVTTLFYEMPASPLGEMPCAAMPLYEAWTFPGPLVCTRLSQVQRAIRIVFPSRLFFWAQDLEWLRPGVFAYEALAPLYRHPEITLLARCTDHQRVLEDAWNRPVQAVVEEGDLEGLWRVVSS